jgi:hypothetical protein
LQALELTGVVSFKPKHQIPINGNLRVLQQLFLCAENRRQSFFRNGITPNHRKNLSNFGLKPQDIVIYF